MDNFRREDISGEELSGRFLFVDDEREYLDILGRCVSALGFEFVAAENGKEAQELLRGQHFDVAISDIRMPELDGIELLRLIKREHPGTDVILMTGFSQAYTFTDVIREGAIDYLEKPFTIDAVQAKILRLLRERALLARHWQSELRLQKQSQALAAEVRLQTRELRATQAAMEAVFQNIPDSILSLDEKMTVTHRNEKCGKYLTMEIGQPFTAGTTKFQEECWRVLRNTLETRTAIRDYRIEIGSGEKGGAVVLVSTSLRQDGAGQYDGVLLVIHDITRLAELENELSERRQTRQMIGNSAAVREIFAKVRKLAAVDTTVLITGESGTGKEILVETLHARGNRADKPLIKVNCAALPENLLESELFGHVRGAFTGAVRDRSGRIQAAEGGILFLDEIGEISLRIQLKLLRFLEVKEYERVGESQTRHADVRLVAATNADLARKVQEGLFREDLYYRLKVMVLHLPPLRERREDIPFLLEHFFAFFNTKFAKSISALNPEARELLLRYDWPGNIRELKHVLEHGFILASGPELRPEHLPLDLQLLSAPPPRAAERQAPRLLTRELLVSVLAQTDGNKAKTARILQLGRTTLYNKLREFNLQNESFD